ncbi:uncharacterized protein LOC120073902 [Benincasa hispida]|uniref:uncharacterized protein LOC120073902 n=1 Tax=Benincasa hispida TaxID=102211 RepID=UPI0019022963|nr:uncharacterized protein LOC120073902 [Benincasa hispida]
MGLPRSLVMLIVQMCFLFLADLVMVRSADTGSSMRSLDALLQEYAYKALVNPKTGVPYDAAAPLNLTGVSIRAMRLRSGSFRRYGVVSFKEFEIPTGVIVQPYVERLVLVYQNLGNWSEEYYALPGYTYLAPVLGLLAYSASNLSATNLPELEMRASGDPIYVKFDNVKSLPDGTVAKCVWFNLQGKANFSSVESGNTCSTIRHGHFSIVVESIAPSPTPPSPPGAVIPNAPPPSRKKNTTRVWIIVGSVLGGALLLVLLALLILWLRKLKKRNKMEQMERAAESGEPLQMAIVGDTKAPTATVTRTQPTLETEYVP